MIFREKEPLGHVGMVEWDSIHCSPQVVEKKAKPHIQVDVGGGQTKTFAPEEISAMVLTKMKETAEAYLGKKVSAWETLVTTGISSFRKWEKGREMGLAGAGSSFLKMG